jgi:hypothetical protein
MTYDFFTKKRLFCVFSKANKSIIEDAILTDCSDPFPAEEYGCGEDDAN